MLRRTVTRYCNAAAAGVAASAAAGKAPNTGPVGGAHSSATGASTAVEASAKAASSHKVAKVPEQKSKMAKIWEACYEGMRHLYHGFRLFGVNTKLAWKYSRQLKRGVALTRRERLLLESSTKDLLRLVPFSFFIVVPFAELLLPIALKMFPGLIPSTFESESQGRNRVFSDAMKSLRARQRVMDYMSSTALATFNEGEQDVIRRVAKGDSITPKDIRLVSPYFGRDGPFSIYKIPSNIVAGVARSVGSYKWYHGVLPSSLSTTLMRRGIIRQYHRVREDDRLLRVEGLDDLTDEELVKANQTRGMRWTETPETLRVQLEWWNVLARDATVPYNTLFWVKPTRYSLRKSMNGIPVTQRRQLLGIQNLPDSVRSSLEALCDTVDTVSTIGTTAPETADVIARKVENIRESATQGDNDLEGVGSIGDFLTEENVKKMYERIQTNKLDDEPVLVSDVIEAIGHETHNSSHVVSTLFDTFDYGAGSKPITETALLSIGARCRDAAGHLAKKEAENKAAEEARAAAEAKALADAKAAQEAKTAESKAATATEKGADAPTSATETPKPESNETSKKDATTPPK